MIDRGSVHVPNFLFKWKTYTLNMVFGNLLMPLWLLMSHFLYGSLLRLIQEKFLFSSLRTSVTPRILIQDITPNSILLFEKRYYFIFSSIINKLLGNLYKILNII